MGDPFEFRQCITLLKATGDTARNLAEFRERLSTVSEGAIYHHTYQYFLKGHIMEFTNDFSEWAGLNLEERELSEELSNVDPYDYPDMNALRAELLRVIQVYLERFPEPRETRPGEQFFFSEAVTLVFKAGVRAKNLAEFLIAVKYVDRSSLYYHFYDSRHRLGGRRNDFSEWIADSLGKKELAEKLMAIDPFVHSLEGIRGRIVAAIEEEVRLDMETAGVNYHVREEIKQELVTAGGRP